ncbi:hypothetical protein D3C81_1894650 [compost metagenome]
MGAEVVALRIGNHPVVRVAGADHAHFVRVVSTGFLQGHAVLPGLPDVTAIELGGAVVQANQETHDFVVGKFVGG